MLTVLVTDMFYVCFTTKRVLFNEAVRLYRGECLYIEEKAVYINSIHGKIVQRKTQKCNIFTCNMV